MTTDRIPSFTHPRKSWVSAAESVSRAGSHKDRNRAVEALFHSPIEAASTPRPITRRRCERTESSAAVAGRFFATLKKVLVNESNWKSREGARADLFDYIEVWYNRERRHSTLGYLSPADYQERRLTREVRNAA